MGLVIYGNLERQTGGYLYDRRLVEFLRQQGVRVEVISLPWRDYVRHLKDNFSPWFFQRLASLEVDCLLQDELNHPSLFLLNRRLRQRVNYPLVSIVHHLRSLEARPAWQNFLYRAVEQRYLTGLDGWVFNSQATRASVEALAGRLAEDRFVVAYPGGDRGKEIPGELEIVQRAHQGGPLHLLFVGNLIPRKGVHLILEALARLPGDSLRLDIAGDDRASPAYTSRLHRLIRRLGLGNRVRIWGSVEDHALVSLYRQAQALVMPSFHEGFGIVYLEAMGFGLPVLATSQGGAAELVTQGENGYLIAPGDVFMLADHLWKWNSDRDELARMGILARRRYLQHPTWDDSMAGIAAWLRKIAR
ncbi:MAG: glycosyltransferase family 4 protein [Chloroflexota bacterium]